MGTTGSGLSVLSIAVLAQPPNALIGWDQGRPDRIGGHWIGADISDVQVSISWSPHRSVLSQLPLYETRLWPAGNGPTATTPWAALAIQWLTCQRFYSVNFKIILTNQSGKERESTCIVCCLDHYRGQKVWWGHHELRHCMKPIRSQNSWTCTSCLHSEPIRELNIKPNEMLKMRWDQVLVKMKQAHKQWIIC